MKKKEQATKAAPRGFDPSSQVGSAVRDARVARRDARGLVPIGEARRIVAATDVYQKGEAKMVGNTSVLESDRVWAALLSLEDAAEFVKHACRIRWEFHVRGRENVALHDRYGDAILPWLESRLRDDGVLLNVPWCVVPCLLAVGTREALELAMRVNDTAEVLPGQTPAAMAPGLFAAASGDEESDDAGAETNDSKDGDEDDEEDGDGGEDDDEDEEEIDDEDEEESDEEEQDDDEESDDADVEDEEPAKDGLELARRWMTRHPDRYGMLAKLADEGHPRAEELLRDRGKALGGVVREALETALGIVEAERIAEKFGIPRLRLPEDVEALLAEAELLDEPRGPLWSIAELDEAARQFDLPLWDNANHTTAAMRITGYASREGDALVIERLVHNPGSGVLVLWEMDAYGPGAKKSRASDEALVDEAADELANVDISDGDYVDGLTNQIVLLGDRDEKGRAVAGADGPRIVPLPLPSDDMIVHLKRPLARTKGDPVRASYRLPRSFASLSPEDLAATRLVTPAEALVVDLARRHRELVFASDRDLRAAVGVSSAAVRLFSFDDFEYVAAGVPASKSKDLVTMVEALRARRRITRLVGHANARPECWIPGSAELRSYAGGDAWSEGDSPIEPALQIDGIGITPYWSHTISRGFPHGVWLLHAAAQNKKAQAEQAIVHLVGSPSPIVHLFWPRRTACLWARVCGLAERAFTKVDRGVITAAKTDRMLYAAEARKLVEGFVFRSWSPPAFVGAEMVLLLEALIGGRETVEAFALALSKLSADAWEQDRPALARAIFELGFVLRRAEGFSGPLTERLAKAWRAGRKGESSRKLDLVVHGRAGAERSARAEADYSFVLDDPAWARERLLDKKTEPSPPDVFLVSLAGEALLAKYEMRLAKVVEAAWVGSELLRLHSPRVVAMALALYAERPDARASISQALFERPNVRPEVEAVARGPHSKVARALLTALDEREERAYARRHGSLDEEDEDDEDDDDDEADDEEDEDDE